MDFLKRNATFLVVTIVTILIIIGGVLLLSKGSSSTTNGTKVSDLLLATPDYQKTSGIVNGKFLPPSKTSTVTITEFGDYQCPACSAYNALVDQFLTDFAGKITFAFKDFSFIGDESLHGAEAASCASDQNRFWEYHEYLYSHQAGENKGAFSDENLKSFAKTLGLDTQSFGKCLDSGKYKDHVESSTNDGKLAGVNSTPSFFVNGILIKNPTSYDEFKKLIQDTLNNNPVTQGTNDLAYHVHFDLKVFVNGSPIDFTLAKYQESKTNPLDENIHFHDGNGKVVHVHKTGVALSELFNSFKLSIPAGTIAYVNGKKVSNILNYVPQDLDQILIGSSNVSLVSNDACIYSLKCPARGTPPPEDCVGGLGTGCSD